MVNTRQFSGSTYMQDITKSHTFSAKNQGSTYTPIRLIRREIRYHDNLTKNIFLCSLACESCSSTACKSYSSKSGYSCPDLSRVGIWNFRVKSRHSQLIRDG